MKKLYLLCAAISFTAALIAQSSAWHIIQLTGDVSYKNQTFQVGDSLYSSDLSEFEFKGDFSAITLYHADYGMVRYDAGTYVKHKNEGADGVGDVLADLLGVKSDYLELKSRGDCECISPLDCLIPDDKLSEWVILSNSIEFSDEAFGRGRYFFQFEHEGEIYNRFLDSENNKVIVDESVFRLDEEKYFDFSSPALLAVIPENESSSPIQTICSVKFKIITEEVLEAFIIQNQRLLGNTPTEKMNQELFYSLYTSFGKIENCELDTWIK